jgi:hypothetical protein
MNRITSASLNQPNATAASSLVNGSMMSQRVSILSRMTAQLEGDGLE